MTTARVMASMLVGLLASTAAAGPGRAASTRPTEQTNLYAGWSAHPNTVVRTVTAAWTVPEVTCGPLIQPVGGGDDNRAAPWIGIWGSNSDDDGVTQLAQLGTESHCVNDWGQPKYWAVGQMYPISDRTTLFDVSAGDHVSVAMTYNGRQPDGKLRYTGSIVVTSGGRGDPRSWYGEFLTEPGVREMDAAGQGGCIVESQPIGDDIAVLAQFDEPIQFSPCRVNGRGLDSFPRSDLTQWVMKANGKDMATTGLVDQRGDFNVRFVSKRGIETAPRLAYGPSVSFRPSSISST